MLTISRPDIHGEDLIDYPLSSRFIKLPIRPYLELLTVNIGSRTTSAWDEINRPQLALINAVNSPAYRFIVAALSRRLGKTFIANVLGQLVTLVPGCNVLIMSPNYNLSSISFELQRHFIKHFNLEIERDNVKDKVIRLENGSEIRMGSVTTVDSSVGRSYDLIIFDEAALEEAGKEAFERSLRPTLDRPGAKAIFISTPRGKQNWFSEFFQRGFSDEYPEWISLRADYIENPRMTEKDVEEAKRSMSRALFEQEYMANFSVYEGLIYEVREEHLVDSLDLSIGGYEIFAGLDPGFKDPTAFVVIAYSHHEDCFYIVEDYMKTEAVTSKHAEVIRSLINLYNIQIIFIDSAAAQFAADLAHEHDISTAKAKKDVLAGIATVQNLLETGRLKILRRCVNTTIELDQYRWDTRSTITTEKPEHKHSHIPDAIRYALHTYTV